MSEVFCEVDKPCQQKRCDYYNVDYIDNCKSGKLSELVELRAQLAEKDREITFRDKWLNQWQLKTKLAIDRAEKAEAELAELRGQNKVLREEENVPYLRELKENAELRERMKPVEEVYKWLQSDECNRWLNASAIGFILDKVVQAIKAACEEE